MIKAIQIVHICEDEKFINSAIDQFENCFPAQNTFYVLPISFEENFKHVKNRTFVHKTKPEDLIQIPSNLSDKSIVVLHSLSPRFYDFVLLLPKDVKIIWFCFGFEVYNDSNYYKNSILLDTITAREFPNKNKTHKQRFIEKIRPFYRLIKKTLPLSQRERKHKVIKRINYLGSSFKEEFEMVCKLINQKKEFFDFWYYPLELIVDSNAPVSLEKKTIIIGNSGSKSGNHLDVFDKIRNYSLQDIEIVVPLNYGDTTYIKEILIEGQNVFNVAFKPLLEFMPIQEYNIILESAGVAVLNNKRQQAIGNTIALLWFGTKVFLSNKNPFYHYLQRKGIIVYCYETELNDESISQFLSLEQIQHNRKLLFQELNKAHLVELLKNQIVNIYG